MLRQERRPQPDGRGSAPADDQIVVGRLAGAYGIKGWIRDSGPVVPAAPVLAACRADRTC